MKKISNAKKAEIKEGIKNIGIAIIFYLACMAAVGVVVYQLLCYVLK